MNDDPRDEAFIQLLEDVRRFNQKPSIEGREIVIGAARKLTWEYKVAQSRNRGTVMPRSEEGK